MTKISPKPEMIHPLLTGGSSSSDVPARVVSASAASGGPPNPPGSATVVTVSTTGGNRPATANSDERQITRVSQISTGPSGTAGSAQGGDKTNPLDYVKNKIAEEMKRDGGNGLKRPGSNDATDEGPSPKKKPDEW